MLRRISLRFAEREGICRLHAASIACSARYEQQRVCVWRLKDGECRTMPVAASIALLTQTERFFVAAFEAPEAQPEAVCEGSRHRGPCD